RLMRQEAEQEGGLSPHGSRLPRDVSEGLRAPRRRAKSADPRVRGDDGWLLRTHGAGLDEAVVPRQRLAQQVRRVLAVAVAAGAVEIVLQQRLEVRVRAALDDQLRALLRRQPAQVGQ